GAGMSRPARASHAATWETTARSRGGPSARSTGSRAARRPCLPSASREAGRCTRRSWRRPRREQSADQRVARDEPLVGGGLVPEPTQLIAQTIELVGLLHEPEGAHGRLEAEDLLADSSAACAPRVAAGRRGLGF